MKLFSDLSKKLLKTRNKWSLSIANLFSEDPVTDEFWLELEEEMIIGDVGIDLTESLINKLKYIVIERKISKTSELKKHFKELLINLLDAIPRMGEPLILNSHPAFVIFIGVNGSGKTTTIGKLAAQLKNEGHKVMLVAADTFRAAAIDQLKAWASKVSIRLVAQKQDSDPAAVVYDAVMSSKASKDDIVLVDTAGRLHTKLNLMEELAKIYRVIQREAPGEPSKVFLVLDAVTGQNGFLQAETFNKVIPITGVVLTKYDNSSKGGVVLSIADKLKLPIRYVGLGENIEDLQLFNSRVFVETLLDANNT